MFQPKVGDKVELIDLHGQDFEWDGKGSRIMQEGEICIVILTPDHHGTCRVKSRDGFIQNLHVSYLAPADVHYWIVHMEERCSGKAI